MDEDNTTFDYHSDDDDTQDASTSSYSWKSSEYIGHEHGAGWYMLLGLATAAIVTVAYFLTKSYFAGGVIAVMGIIVGVFAKREPKEVSYKITDNGLKIGHKLYPFGLYRSFYVARTTTLSSINLIPIKRLSPPISAFFEPAKETKILEAIGDHLPYEERKADSIDRIAHKLKL
jgi:hypothetical protein